MNISQVIAKELNTSNQQVEAAIELLDGGATVPFIARYRKEATGGLDDIQLRELSERLIYLREMEERRESILEEIKGQGKLTPELEKSIKDAETKSRLEDLYLPYKPKRRTKAQIAREAGLEPLAKSLLSDPTLVPLEEAKAFINKEAGFEDPEATLEGAKQILMEDFAEDADLLEKSRDYVRTHASIISRVIEGQEEAGAKFKDYFEFSEAVKKVPSHRTLAMLRGQKENILRVTIGFEEESNEDALVRMVSDKFNIQDKNRAADEWLKGVADWTWRVKLKTKLIIDIMTELRVAAEESAIHVFQDNLKNLLMMPPAGKKVTMGLDPGYRTGVKVVVVDDTGKLLAFDTIFPHPPQKKWSASLATLEKLCEKYRVDLISIGNGTASRETDKLAAELLQKCTSLNLVKAIVSEAGASVYSASELASKEFPELDVSYRGAVSIARRLQDPLAELVKIDPKAIGVGQYQHDVNQVKLARGLTNVLEDCVNTVGADVNTASVQLLKSISGLSESVARNIVDYRETNGRFKSREALMNVPRMGGKTYEQAVGFLRIVDGDNPLDASAVHPESYPIVDAIIQKSHKEIKELMGNIKLLESINCSDFVKEGVGLPTIRDIVEELKKPGRDPRPEFVTAKLQDGVESIQDLAVGMILEGTVSNVTHFGAFVDLGVHQDGLVHVSELANKFVSNPQDIVKTGQVVTVRVIGVDVKRNRIELSMRLETEDKRPKEERPARQKSKVQKETKPERGLLGELLAKELNKAK